MLQDITAELLLWLGVIAGAIVGAIIGQLVTLVTGEAGWWIVGLSLGAIVGMLFEARRQGLFQ